MNRQKELARGFVFLDDNETRQYQVGKKGVAGVAVSNGWDVTLTDENGYYTLPVKGPGPIFISKPAGYELPLNEFNQPQFYYLHYPAGTPDWLELNHEGIQPSGPLPDMINFPLIKSKNRDQFKAVFCGDIQAKTETEIGYFRDLVAGEIMQENPDFFVPLGDIAWDDLEHFPLLRETISSIGLPYYATCGNHDINIKAPDRQYANQTFQRFFGPAYYSFNYGKVHFVVLDDIGYEGWNESDERPGSLYGWIDEKQLQWLANDLKDVPYDHLIFICSHIPIYTNITPDDTYRNILNRFALFEVLRDRKHLFAVAGHTHYVEQTDMRDAGWRKKQDFHSMIVGAACGAWWKGPLDPFGYPVRLGMDGTPNGFFVFEFDGSEFDFQFHPIGMSKENHMAIRFPSQEVEQTALASQSVVANIYAASPNASVVYQINGQEKVNMSRTVTEDPFVLQYLIDHEADYPAWMYARRTAHLWTAPMPADLQPGVHTIQVTATEPKGKLFTKRQSFRVVAHENGRLFEQEEIIGRKAE